MKVITLLLSTLVLLAVAAAVFVWSGVYDIGADRPHWAPTARAIAVLRDRSIEHQASGITVPDLDDPQRIHRGAEHYAEMCAACHLTPGMHGTELRTGLYPQPPDLSRHGVRDAAEAFWVIKHGVKLTAMPAWGLSHDDAAIWDMVAFVRKLPTLDEATFEAMAGVSVNDGHGGHEQAHHDEAGAQDHPDDHEGHNDGDHDHDDHGSH
jgi:mono/diheme cytochrome c family protein